MKDLNNRPISGKDGEKPWYKRWKSWAIIVAALIVINIFYPDQPEKAEPASEVEAEKSPEEIAMVKAEKESKMDAKLAEIDAQIAEEERLAEEKVTVTSSPVLDRSVEIRALTEKYADKYDGSEIVELKINENLGADDGSYIVLAYMTYPRQNSAKMSREMIEMYSSDLAANLAKEADVGAVTVFWEVPRFVEGSNAAKYAYERLGDGMRLESQHIAPELQ